jgi:hypothetical protein
MMDTSFAGARQPLPGQRSKERIERWESAPCGLAILLSEELLQVISASRQRYHGECPGAGDFAIHKV